MRSFVLAMSMLSCVFLASSTASAAIIETYTDRDDWLSAVGGTADFLIDFNSYTEQTFLAENFGPFTATSDAGAYVDVPPFLFADPNDLSYSNGTSTLFLYVDGAIDSKAYFNFSAPIIAFFADFYSPGNDGNPLELEISFESNQVEQTAVGQAFQGSLSFGFIASSPISQMTFFNTRSDGFTIDDIALKGLRGESTLVSEPTTFGILFFGAVLVLALSRQSGSVRKGMEN